MSKFQTTNSSLFNNNNGSQVPEWMQQFTNNIEANKTKKEMNINFDVKGSFANGPIVERPELNATPREVIAGLNNEKLMLDSKVLLAKFLIGKYYKTEPSISGNKAYLNTTIDGIQANFSFPYSFTNGKVINDDTFLVNESEYPFSKAGFDECLHDLKTGNLKKAQTKIASSRETFVINREEIVRRYNGHLREATDAINKHLSEGMIVGAGSNSYATYYNPDELFPQMEKEVPQLPDGSFEYVANSEHVKPNEYKSAKNLSLEASKMLSNIFSDFIINYADRDKNELLVNATVLNNGIRHKINFNFAVQNEKIAKLQLAEIDDQRMTITTLLEKMKMNNNNLVNQYLKSATASKKIVEGSILTYRELKDKLSPMVGLDRVNDFINAWLGLRAITQLNSTTYISTYSIEELLNMVESETLSEEEIAQVSMYKKHFGDGLDFERIEQEDTIAKELSGIELNTELQLGKINTAMSKEFSNYQIINYDNNIVKARFVNNGVRHVVNLAAKFNGQQLVSLNAIIKGKEIPLSKMAQAFEVNPTLKVYLKDKTANDFSSNIVASKRNILNRLSAIVQSPQEVFASWEKDYLSSIGNNVYTSQYSFEELLNKTSAQLLSDDDREQILIAKQYFGNGFKRIAEKDTGIRNMEDRVTDETLLYAANNYLSQHFSNYVPKFFNVITSGIDDTALYQIELFDDETGLCTDVNFQMTFNKNKLIDCCAILNKSKVSMGNIKKAFAMNEALSKYLQNYNGKKFNAPMIITKAELSRKLAKITNADNNEVEHIINNWKSIGRLNQLDSNTYASKCSLETLISMSNIKPLSDAEIADKLNKSRRDKMLSLSANYIKDNDTRKPIETWSSEQMALHGRAVIGSMFADFDIIDAAQNNTDYIITARIINPVNGLKQVLDFKFSTINNTKLGEVVEISNGIISVNKQNILQLLNSTNESVNKFVELNKASNKREKSIISNSNLKSKLLGVMDINQYSSIVSHLITAGILNQVDNYNFATEYSLSEIVEYLHNQNKLDVTKAANNLKSFGKDVIVDTNIKHVKDTDNRVLAKPEEKLTPQLIKASESINKIATHAVNNKKITRNKYAQIIESLNNSVNANDIETVWRELKKYV